MRRDEPWETSTARLSSQTYLREHMPTLYSIMLAVAEELKKDGFQNSFLVPICAHIYLAQMAGTAGADYYIATLRINGSGGEGFGCDVFFYEEHAETYDNIHHYGNPDFIEALTQDVNRIMENMR